MSDQPINEIFVDGIMNISYNSGAFRYELVSVNPTQGDEKAEPEIIKHSRIVMTPQGFIQTVNAFKSFLEQVEDKGIIRREAQDEAVIEKKSTKEKAK